MPELARDALTLQTLCSEAVAIFGDDWKSIEAYVRGRVSRLAPGQRQALFRDVSRILQFDRNAAPHGDGAKPPS